MTTVCVIATSITLLDTLSERVYIDAIVNQWGFIKMKDLEIARLRNTLKAWVVIATVATGFALLLAFEVLELRDKLVGVL